MASLAHTTIVDESPVAPPPFDPAPLIGKGRNWTKWAGPVISAGVLGAVLWQMQELDFAEVAALVPSSLSFWLAFTLCYLASPFCEWMIFRKLWRIPAAGFGALLKKKVSNEILLGYLGEVYFYAWARRRAEITTAPFGAIKDVTILSALAGNAVTLLMLALAFPLFGSLNPGKHATGIYLSIGVTLAISLAMMLFRRRLFSLPGPELRFVLLAHLIRLAIATALTAYMWHLVLPSVAMGWWLLLSTVRLLVSRLPFLPNKDLVFAGLAVVFIGHDVAVADLMTMMASVILAAHVTLGAALGISGLLGEGDKA